MRLLSPTRNPLFDLLGLTLLLALVLGFSLGDRPFSAPSESRYVEIGREMAESGDFVTPRLNYVKYFEKPPLFYWIQAENTKLFGLTPFAARLPNALFALGLCLLTYMLGRMLYGRLAGILSALVLATSLYLFALSRVVLLDVPVSFFLVGTLSGFLYAAYAPRGAKRTLVIYAMYAMAAGAVLTKGLIGIVLPGAVICLWLASTRQWRLLKDMRIGSGLVLFLALCAPWHIMVAARNPEWSWFYFIHEHWLRYTTPEAGRSQPVWFFIVVLTAGLFPWVAFLYQSKKRAFSGFWRNRFQDGRPLYLALWATFIFVFFSLSHSKLIAYILPLFPPLAVVIGRYLADAWKGLPVRGFTIGLGVMVLLLASLALGPSLALGLMDPDSKVVAAMTEGGDDLHTLSFCCMIAAGALLVVAIQGQRRHVIIAMFLAAVMVMELSDAVAGHYTKDSMLAFSQTINSVHKPGDETALYHTYYQDLPLYIKQRVIIVDRPTELDFGAAHQDAPWIMKTDTFWKEWMSNRTRMFVVMRQEDYDRLTKDKTPEQQHLWLVQKDGRNLLLLNRDPMELKEPPKKPKTDKHS